MPRERKQRGKRKRKQEPEEESKETVEVATQQPQDNAAQDEGTHAEFFGLLDDDEQAYFKTVDETLQADEFTSAEESELFVTNVLKEAEGKELRMATSPLGSKVLEALLARSSPRQVITLFKAFTGHFVHLMQQRYASHACEMLFAIMSTLVDGELAGTLQAGDEDEVVSCENLFLFMLNEIQPHVATTLANGHYAAHVLRDVLLVLQGNLFTFEKAKKQAKRYHGQKKFLWSRPERAMSVPPSFGDHLRSIVSAMQALPEVQVRMLASQPASLGLVSAVISAESGEHKVLDTLLGDLQTRQDFVETMMRESTSSQVLELAIDAMSEARLHNFFETYLRGHVARAAHNDVTNHILQRYVARANGDALKTIVAELEPAVKDLIEVKHVAVLQGVLEAAARVGEAALGERVFESVIDALLRDGQKIEVVSTLLQEAPTQGAYFLTSCLDLPAPRKTIVDSLLAMDTDAYVALASQPASLHLLTSTLKHDALDIITRRKMLNPFTGRFATLATDKVGSHFLDAVFELCKATDGLKLIAQRVAGELLSATAIGRSAQAAAVANVDETKVDLRTDFYGRLCWRNWQMDMYQRRRGDWERLFSSTSASPAQPVAEQGQKKRSIAEAALAHAQAKRGGQRAFATGANADANIHPDRAARNNKRPKFAAR